MFKKILIANRGEIACRVIKTAKKLGIATVAVYSDADAQAQHVKLADEAVYIGASAAAQSYLQINKIIEAAKKTNSQAIHPGYGFLSENADFAQACQNNNIVFIGPSAQAILAMGLKATSKALMEKAGVPLTPGYHGSNQEALFLQQQADQIGYPVLIKASAGGGGKGMSLVENSADFIQALASCKREAKSSFGNDDVLIERYVIQPRHVEVQIFGDSHGNYVHLFERDCSVQRRHQKVLEEAPAPLLPEAKLALMRQAAIEAAKAVNYVGAGTVEFIVEQDGTAYFMEMNTRLQVEHPVTEMITRQDLVEWQLRVAYGEVLPKTQEQLQIQGHAIEARVYAEEPEKGFLPSVGHINYLHYPEENQGVRVDTGISQGDEISSYYDPMIAKLIVWGSDRQAALVQMQRALEQFHVSGVGNNIAFLHRLVSCDAFTKARLDTGLIQKEEAFLLPKTQTISTQTVLIAAYLVFLQDLQNCVQSLFATALWRNNVKSDYRIKLRYKQEAFEVLINHSHDGVCLSLAGQTLLLNAEQIGLNQLSLDVNGIKQTIYFHQDEKQVLVYEQAASYCFDKVKPQAFIEESASGSGDLQAPMPGAITQVFVKEHDTVKKDDILMTLEAMKMEYAILAPYDGVVSGVFFQVGELVKSGQELLAVEAVGKE